MVGANMAQQAQIQQKALVGPPVMPLVLEPYFVGGPETLKGKMEAIRDCGVGAVDLATVMRPPPELTPFRNGGTRIKLLQVH
jgi:hypothetical protein